MAVHNVMMFYTDAYGCFEICPHCYLPRVPDKLTCSWCEKTEPLDNKTMNKFLDFLYSGDTE